MLLGDYSCHVTESSEQSIDVESVYIHSKYHHSTHANDIALIKLARDVDTSRGDVIPACLPIHGSKTFEPGDACFVTGWGETGGVYTCGHKVTIIIIAILCKQLSHRPPVTMNKDS